MDYKEKYENALERARNIRFGNPNSATANVVCESIFPELKMSEDERIRKAIKHQIEKLDDEGWSGIDGVEYADMLAWLEKQGEQKPAWSEDDEKMLNRVNQSLYRYQDHLIGSPLADDVEIEINWLKSIKDRVQPHWKPTGEQMEAFGNAIEFLKDNDYSVHELIILFNDLQFMRV